MAKSLSLTNPCRQIRCDATAVIWRAGEHFACQEWGIVDGGDVQSSVIEVPGTKWRLPSLYYPYKDNRTKLRVYIDPLILLYLAAYQAAREIAKSSLAQLLPPPSTFFARIHALN